MTGLELKLKFAIEGRGCWGCRYVALDQLILWRERLIVRIEGDGRLELRAFYISRT